MKINIIKCNTALPTNNSMKYSHRLEAQTVVHSVPRQI